jgi:hypothetical protein
MNPAESCAIANELGIEPAEEKAQLPPLITIPFIEVSTEDLAKEITPIEVIDEKELTLVVRITSLEQKRSAYGEDQKNQRPEPLLAAATGTP